MKLEDQVSPEDAPSDSQRRQLLRGAAALGAGLALGSRGIVNAAAKGGAMPGAQPLPLLSGTHYHEPHAATPRQALAATPVALGGGTTTPGQIPRRPLGRHGVMISALGCGGHHLGDAKSVDEAVNIVHEAIDGGINFFDNCWEYHNGKSEDWLGRGLKGRRDQVFLMTKVCTHGRNAQLAMQMLEESLRRLQTDHLDLWQIHGVTYDNDPDLAYAKGGVLEAFDKAKKQGKVRFVGFSGHKDPGIHLQMIRKGYPFDTVQMPLNPFDASFFSFQDQVVPEAHRRGIAVLGMKPMSGTSDPVKKGLITAAEALRYAMSLPVTTTISGMDSLEVLHKNLQVAQNFVAMTPAEMQDLRARCAAPAADGRYELYKVSIKYDNPEARRPHRFPIDSQQKEIKEMLQEASGQKEAR